MYLARAFLATSTILLWILAQVTSAARELRAGNGKGSKKKKCYKAGKSNKGKTDTAGVAGKVFSGAKIPIGDGLMWSFVEWDAEGDPSRIGFKFTIDDFNTLPTTESDGTWDIRDAAGASAVALGGHEYIPNLPYFQGPSADKLVFEHLVANYNPNGHGPPGVYSVPHFDMHFYLIPNKERVGCVLSPLDTARCPSAAVTAAACPALPPTLFVDCDGANYLVEPLPADMTPAGYENVCANEPGMGDHLIRPAAPEFNGSPFTHTWIWGRQGGRIHFWEPMITVAFLETVRTNAANVGWYNSLVYLGKEVMTTEGSGVEVPISGLTTAAGDSITQAKAGLYPTSYRILYDMATKTFTVDLIGFEGLCETDTPKDLTCPDFVPEVAPSSKSGKSRRH